MKEFAKRYIAISIMAVLLIMTALLSGCSGYNKLMREYLSNPDKYFRLELEVVGIQAYNNNESSDNCFTNITGNDDINIEKLYSVYVDCVVVGIVGNDGDAYGDDFYANQPTMNFQILKENVIVLLSTNFFDVVHAGDKLAIRSTIWIYMDSEFNYLAEISLNGTTYLNFNEGFKNIVDHMNANKSLI